MHRHRPPAKRSCAGTDAALPQKRKCTSLLNSNKRKLDRDIAGLRTTEAKTRSLIVAASKRAQKAAPGSALATQAASETRVFAREMVRIRKQAARLHTSKATLASVGMQVQEAFAVRRIEGSLRASTGIMKDVNSLVRLPELTGTMRELSQELVRAGIIEEMVSDSLDSEGLEEFEDEEVEGEVDRVLGEVLRDRTQTPAVPVVPVERPAAVAASEEEEDMDSEEMLAQMRGRLEALKS
nr:vacuolar protein-sorting-associated protein 24 [Quercus suber]